MKTRHHETTIVVAQIERPFDGPSWQTAKPPLDLPISGLPAWQSNGGPTRGHLARSLPFSFEAKLPDYPGQLLRVHLVGLFALHAGKASESVGTLGATVQLLAGDREIAARYDLINGRHYLDATQLNAPARVAGDGTSIETVGKCEVREETYRVDLLTLDVPLGVRPKRLLFRDMGSPASFAIFDVFFEYEGALSENARRRDQGLSLSELGATIRVGDRLKFARAVEQLDHAIDEAENIDEARGHALAFLGVMCAALLEVSGALPAPCILLDAARQLDAHTTRAQIKEAIRDRVLEATDGLFAPAEGQSHRLMDRALAIVDRHYAKDISDAMVAAQLGLSTSHFRFLFRQTTGHPFHKYVVALRLEKARQMLVEQELPVTQVAAAVGFAGLSHFSRAFTQRFSASPSHIRRVAS
ncbi:MAG: helix-turn-helix domain-containing protein [Fimbriimonadales bacterium]